MLIGVNANHTQAFDFTFLENFLGMFDTMLGNLGDVDQTFNITFKAGKSAEFDTPAPEPEEETPSDAPETPSEE